MTTRAAALGGWVVISTGICAVGQAGGGLVARPTIVAMAVLCFLSIFTREGHPHE